ncbi:hypothetical protein [Salibacterium aidingense]|uniref:hypothetical protein n=1 Tax=Salibacterium aidingense TaxID=384933 RepID=UPI00047BEE25|nr:hypothetical protein [Salibacterium aidingense]
MNKQRKQILKFSIISLFLCGILSACGAGPAVDGSEKQSEDNAQQSTNENNESSENDDKEEITIEMDEFSYSEEDDNYHIEGTTNLPNDAILWVVLQSQIEKESYAYNDTTVDDGHFVINISDSFNTLVNGEYIVTARFGGEELGLDGNEEIKNAYGDFEEFKKNYKVDGKLIETENGYRAYNIVLGEQELTEEYTVEEYEEEKLAEKKANAKEIDYGQLSKNPERYSGDFVKFEGRILQIQENNSTGSTTMRVAVTKDEFGYNQDDVIWVEYDDFTKFVEGHTIAFYGEVVGSKTYTSQADFQITVPEVKAEDIEEIIGWN